MPDGDQPRMKVPLPGGNRSFAAPSADVNGTAARVSTIEALWTAADLAVFLGLAEKTVTMYASTQPDRLPPRVRTLHYHRWVPAVCQDWAVHNSGQAVKRKAGRPRAQ